MNEMNSIGNSRILPIQWTPGGTNREKKCSPCFQKPTPSTIAKLISDMTPVKVNWLVTVNGCAAADNAEGHVAHEVREQQEDEGGEHPRQVLLAFGADARVDHVVDEADQPFDRDLPAAGDQLALHPADMKNQIVPSTISVHSALLVKTNGLSALERTEDRLDHELVHRVDLAGRHA